MLSIIFGDLPILSSVNLMNSRLPDAAFAFAFDWKGFGGPPGLCPDDCQPRDFLAARKTASKHSAEEFKVSWTLIRFSSITARQWRFRSGRFIKEMREYDG